MAASYLYMGVWLACLVFCFALCSTFIVVVVVVVVARRSLSPWNASAQDCKQKQASFGFDEAHDGKAPKTMRWCSTCSKSYPGCKDLVFQAVAQPSPCLYEYALS